MATHDEHSPTGYHETLRPLADDIDPESFVRPSRAPWVVSGIVLAVAAVAGLFAISSRPSNLASVQAVLDEAKARQVDEEVRSHALAAQPIAGPDASEVQTKLSAALPAAGKACGVALQPGARVNLRVTIAADGSIAQSEVMNPPFAMTGLGNCLASRLATTKLPAFVGQPVVVTKILEVN